jgi:hypothetical protein
MNKGNETNQISRLYTKRANARSLLLHAQLSGDKAAKIKYGKMVREITAAINELNGH